MLERKDNVISHKSKDFAIKIIRCYQYLTNSKSEYVMSKQLLRSGTSIGANIRESINAQSRPDFISKLCIALKEAEETDYWLELLQATDYLNDEQHKAIHDDCIELVKLLTSIIKSTKGTD